MKIAIIGDGNVSWHFARKLLRNTSVSLVVHTRHPLKDTWQTLSGFNHSPSTVMDSEVALVIITVADRAIDDVVEQYAFPHDCLVVHTAGSVSMDPLKKYHRHGVIYPLQTLRAGYEVDELPLMIEGSSEAVTNELKEIAEMIGSSTYFISSENRKHLHLMAVFASNFFNHLLAITEKIGKEQSIDASLLKPLISETMRKAFDMGAFNAQTGPAVRKDQSTIQAHLEMLTSAYEKQVYRQLSQGIVSYSSNE